MNGNNGERACYGQSGCGQTELSGRNGNEKIKSRASLDVVTCGKKHVIESNEVSAEKIELFIFEEQTCCVCFDGDEICYKVSIFNNSCVALRDVEFKDVLTGNALFEKHSFRVNGKKENCEVNGGVLSYRIGEIKGKERIDITFNCKVL